ncbi:hypothetical protein LSH36_206g02036 [Paralvinella palmiformis]|uniref:Uncharacterized protein n=1 Tax=Paralvinella palmiformis TaxID=53620 RepID=A0AAD9JPW7_9ANNE|nr:hypothetical protein LSH36_206g02036 [Paralvinella palmiformis]
MEQTSPRNSKAGIEQEILDRFADGVRYDDRLSIQGSGQGGSDPFNGETEQKEQVGYHDNVCINAEIGQGEISSVNTGNERDETTSFEEELTTTDAMRETEQSYAGERKEHDLHDPVIDVEKPQLTQKEKACVKVEEQQDEPTFRNNRLSQDGCDYLKLNIENNEELCDADIQQNEEITSQGLQEFNSAEKTRHQIDDIAMQTAQTENMSFSLETAQYEHVTEDTIEDDTVCSNEKKDNDKGKYIDTKTDRYEPGCVIAEIEQNKKDYFNNGASKDECEYLNAENKQNNKDHPECYSINGDEDDHKSSNIKEVQDELLSLNDEIKHLVYVNPEMAQCASERPNIEFKHERSLTEMQEDENSHREIFQTTWDDSEEKHYQGVSIATEIAENNHVSICVGSEQNKLTDTDTETTKGEAGIADNENNETKHFDLEKVEGEYGFMKSENQQNHDDSESFTVRIKPDQMECESQQKYQDQAQDDSADNEDNIPVCFNKELGKDQTVSHGIVEDQDEIVCVKGKAVEDEYARVYDEIKQLVSGCLATESHSVRNEHTNIYAEPTEEQVEPDPCDLEVTEDHGVLLITENKNYLPLSTKSGIVNKETVNHDSDCCFVGPHNNMCYDGEGAKDDIISVNEQSRKCSSNTDEAEEDESSYVDPVTPQYITRSVSETSMIENKDPECNNINAQPDESHCVKTGIAHNDAVSVINERREDNIKLEDRGLAQGDLMYRNVENNQDVSGVDFQQEERLISQDIHEGHITKKDQHGFVCIDDETIPYEHISISSCSKQDEPMDFDGSEANKIESVCTNDKRDQDDWPHTAFNNKETAQVVPRRDVYEIDQGDVQYLSIEAAQDGAEWPKSENKRNEMFIAERKQYTDLENKPNKPESRNIKKVEDNSDRNSIDGIQDEPAYVMGEMTKDDTPCANEMISKDETDYFNIESKECISVTGIKANEECYTYPVQDVTEYFDEEEVHSESRSVEVGDCNAEVEQGYSTASDTETELNDINCLASYEEQSKVPCVSTVDAPKTVLANAEPIQCGQEKSNKQKIDLYNIADYGQVKAEDEGIFVAKNDIHSGMVINANILGDTTGVRDDQSLVDIQENENKLLSCKNEVDKNKLIDVVVRNIVDTILTEIANENVTPETPSTLSVVIYEELDDYNIDAQTKYVLDEHPAEINTSKLGIYNSRADSVNSGKVTTPGHGGQEVIHFDLGCSNDSEATEDSYGNNMGAKVTKQKKNIDSKRDSHADCKQKGRSRSGNTESSTVTMIKNHPRNDGELGQNINSTAIGTSQLRNYQTVMDAEFRKPTSNSNHMSTEGDSSPKSQKHVRHIDEGTDTSGTERYLTDNEITDNDNFNSGATDIYRTESQTRNNEANKFTKAPFDALDPPDRSLLQYIGLQCDKYQGISHSKPTDTFIGKEQFSQRGETKGEIDGSKENTFDHEDTIDTHINRQISRQTSAEEDEGGLVNFKRNTKDDEVLIADDKTNKDTTTTTDCNNQTLTRGYPSCYPEDDDSNEWQMNEECVNDELPGGDLDGTEPQEEGVLVEPIEKTDKTITSTSSQSKASTNKRLKNNEGQEDTSKYGNNNRSDDVSVSLFGGEACGSQVMLTTDLELLCYKDRSEMRSRTKVKDWLDDCVPLEREKSGHEIMSEEMAGQEHEVGGKWKYKSIKDGREIEDSIMKKNKVGEETTVTRITENMEGIDQDTRTLQRTIEAMVNVDNNTIVDAQKDGVKAMQNTEKEGNCDRQIMKLKENEQQSQAYCCEDSEINKSVGDFYTRMAIRDKVTFWEDNQQVIPEETLESDIAERSLCDPMIPNIIVSRSSHSTSFNCSEKSPTSQVAGMTSREKFSDDVFIDNRSMLLDKSTSDCLPCYENHEHSSFSTPDSTQYDPNDANNSFVKNTQTKIGSSDSRHGLIDHHGPTAVNVHVSTPGGERSHILVDFVIEQRVESPQSSSMYMKAAIKHQNISSSSSQADTDYFAEGTGFSSDLASEANIEYLCEKEKELKLAVKDENHHRSDRHNNIESEEFTLNEDIESHILETSNKGITKEEERTRDDFFQSVDIQLFKEEGDYENLPKQPINKYVKDNVDATDIGIIGVEYRDSGSILVREKQIVCLEGSNQFTESATKLLVNDGQEIESRNDVVRYEVGDSSSNLMRSAKIITLSCNINKTEDARMQISSDRQKIEEPRGPSKLTQDITRSDSANYGCRLNQQDYNEADNVNITVGDVGSEHNSKPEENVLRTPDAERPNGLHEQYQETISMEARATSSVLQSERCYYPSTRKSASDDDELQSDDGISQSTSIPSHEFDRLSSDESEALKIQNNSNRIIIDSNKLCDGVLGTDAISSVSHNHPRPYSGKKQRQYVQYATAALVTNAERLQRGTEADKCVKDTSVDHQPNSDQGCDFINNPLEAVLVDTTSDPIIQGERLSPETEKMETVVSASAVSSTSTVKVDDRRTYDATNGTMINELNIADTSRLNKTNFEELGNRSDNNGAAGMDWNFTDYHKRPIADNEMDVKNSKIEDVVGRGEVNTQRCIKINTKDDSFKNVDAEVSARDEAESEVNQTCPTGDIDKVLVHQEYFEEIAHRDAGSQVFHDAISFQEFAKKDNTTLASRLSYISDNTLPVEDSRRDKNMTLGSSSDYVSLAEHSHLKVGPTATLSDDNRYMSNSSSSCADDVVPTNSVISSKMCKTSPLSNSNGDEKKDTFLKLILNTEDDTKLHRPSFSQNIPLSRNLRDGRRVTFCPGETCKTKATQTNFKQYLIFHVNDGGIVVRNKDVTRSISTDTKTKGRRTKLTKKPATSPERRAKNKKLPKVKETLSSSPVICPDPSSRRLLSRQRGSESTLTQKIPLARGVKLSKRVSSREFLVIDTFPSHSSIRQTSNRSTKIRSRSKSPSATLRLSPPNLPKLLVPKRRPTTVKGDGRRDTKSRGGGTKSVNGNICVSESGVDQFAMYKEKVRVKEAWTKDLMFPGQQLSLRADKSK